MTEAKPEHSKPDEKATRLETPLVLLFTVIVGFMVFAGIGEHLRPEEAKFLNQVIEPSSTPPIPIVLQSMWADFCGLMERPSRLLGLLSGLGGLLLLLATVRRSGGSTFLALAAAGAMGLALTESVLIGGSGFVFFAVAAGVHLLQRLFGLPLRALAFLSIALVVAAQFGMGLAEGPSDSMEAWFRFGPDLAYWGLPQWLGASLIALLLAVAFLAIEEPDGFLLVGCALGVTFITDAFGLTLGPVSSVIAGYSVPLCLWLGIPRKSKKWTKNLAMTCCLVTALVIGTEVFRTLNTPDGRTDRIALDWVASKMPSSSWLAIDGERKDVVRYFEYCGHRTGHRSILIRDEADLARLVRVALYEKPTRICLFDVDEKAIKGLLARYTLTPMEGQPDGVSLASFQRRN
ncbi:MAG: hypothetical protein ACI97A_001923 [Planctomycetota bacterium]|jgi:hypothetical protein